MTACPNAGPEETARAFVDALNGGRWREAAALVLPQHAERHRIIELSMVLDYAREREKGTVMDGTNPFTLRGDPVVDQLEMRRLSNTLVPGYRGASTLADVAEIPAGELMAQVLENVQQRPWGFPNPERFVWEVGRVVADGDAAARMLYRVDTPQDHVPGEGPHLREMEMRKEGGRWYVLPRPDTLFCGAGIQVVFRWIREAEAAGREQNGGSGF